MGNYRRRVIAAAVIGLSAALLPATGVGAAEGAAFKLEGAWVARANEAPLVWTYVVSPDASGLRATLHGSLDVGLSIPGFPPDYVSSPLIGEVVSTGPRSAKFNSMWYLLGAGTGGLTHVILLVGVNKGEIRFVGEGRMEGTHHIAYYVPGTFGTDAYGFPLPGQDPVAQLTFTTKDARLAAP